MGIDETFMKSTDPLQIIPMSSPSDCTHQSSLGNTELVHLQGLVREKAALIEKLTEENQYLYAQIERLEEHIKSEIKRSDAMIGQMQAASEESDKHAQAIIIHLSQQVAQQAEQIEILQELQGFSGAIRQTVRQLKSRMLRERLAAG